MLALAACLGAFLLLAMPASSDEMPDEPSGDKWTVPVGVFAGKTIKVGRTPVNIKLGIEYSVVSPDTFGKRAQIRLQLTPVIPGLVQSPIFGGAK
jgi:hypothetical protein